MRCKKHPADFTSGVGVCASCLRHRLFAVMAAQAQLDRRKSDTQQQLSFPRSVSPYVSHRKSSTNSETLRIQSNAGNQRFHSTPHVGPNGAVTAEIAAGKETSTTTTKTKKKMSNGGKFSNLLLRIFRSKSNKPDSDSVRTSDPGTSRDYSCTSSPSVFSITVPRPRRRRRKQTRTFSLDEGAIAAHRKAYNPNRDCGMSPATRDTDADDDDEEHFHGGSSGYSSEASQYVKQTPRMTPSTARRAGSMAASHTRTISGLAFCLSPLVNRPWNKIGLPPEMAAMVGGGGDHSTKPRLSSATSFCKNRSRKLADFGRPYNH